MRTTPVPRSHPPTLIKLAERTLRDECSLDRGARILVAVSGGPDSLALLHVLSILAPRLGFGVFAHGVDHGLRDSAHAELDVAAALADDLEVRFTRSRVRLAAGGNLQARARDARYAALRRAARRDDCGWIATAHHADDRAETVLIRLLRGTRPGGLAVLPPQTQSRVRPFIRARRTDVLRHMARHEIAYASDPSNEDRRFLRVRIRHEVMPLLESLSPGVVGHLNALADELLEGPAPEVLDESGRTIPLQRAHIRQIRRALKLKQKRAAVRLPGGRTIRADPDTGELELVTGQKHAGISDKGGAKRHKSG